VIGGVAWAKGSAGRQSAEKAGGESQPSISITSARNDFASDYNTALSSGKPIFVYFHTTTCPSCKAFSPVIEKVMPDYKDKVVFVNAYVDLDSAAWSMATDRGFEYVPTSLFLKAGGGTDTSFVGPMTENELRRKLSTMAGL
jgi:thioredoxin-like negative regulator of GroEL